MSNISKLVLAGVAGTLVGAFGLTSLSIAIMPKKIKQDGQAIMLVYLTVPLGAALGLLSGSYLVFSRVGTE